MPSTGRRSSADARPCPYNPLARVGLLGACSTAWKPPEITYDDTPRKAVLSPDPPKSVRIVEIPKPLPLPGQLKPIPAETRRLRPPIPALASSTRTAKRACSQHAPAISMPSRCIPSQMARSTSSMPRPARSPTSRSRPESSLSARSGRRGRHRAMGDWRHRERNGSVQTGSHPDQADPAGSRH